MAFIPKFFRGIRRHWKKSTFASCALVYSASWVKQNYEINLLMQNYCQEALQFGRDTINNSFAPRKVTVILNPAANKRKALDNYKNYCAPILNLAGICVDVIQTESEGHAKELVKSIGNAGADALIVAGGDGTLAEVVTGIMRLTSERNASSLLPIGILPLGKTNSIAQNLFPGGKHLSEIKCMAEASMAVLKNVKKPIDVMKIEILDDNIDNESSSIQDRKPVYALSSIEWGAYRDASSNSDKYWYYGPLRKYATYIFNGFKNNLTWKCHATLNFTPPCEGCSNCTKVEEKSREWYHRFLPTSKNTTNDKLDKSKILNESCKSVKQKEITTADLACLTSNTLDQSLNSGPPKLHLNLGPSDVDYLSFVKEGWQSEKGVPRSVEEIIEARQIEIRPNLAAQEEEDVWFSIDKDNFEAKPIKVTLLPKAIHIFCSVNDNVNLT